MEAEAESDVLPPRSGDWRATSLPGCDSRFRLSRQSKGSSRRIRRAVLADGRVEISGELHGIRLPGWDGGGAKCVRRQSAGGLPGNATTTPSGRSVLLVSQRSGGAIRGCSCSSRPVNGTRPRGPSPARCSNDFAAYDCRQNWAFFRSSNDSDEMREWPWDRSELGPVVAHYPSEAAALLRAAGYDQDSPLPLNVDVPPALSPGATELPIYDQTTATLLAAEQWQAALGGLVAVERREQNWRVTVERSNWTRFDRFPNDEAEIIFGLRNQVYDVDPDDLAYAELHSNGRANPSGIADPEIDEWSVAQRQAVDPFERADVLGTHPPQSPGRGLAHHARQSLSRARPHDQRLKSAQHLLRRLAGTGHEAT